MGWVRFELNVVDRWSLLSGKVVSTGLTACHMLSILLANKATSTTQVKHVISKQNLDRRGKLPLAIALLS